jgi:hypothetical protein
MIVLFHRVSLEVKGRFNEIRELVLDDAWLTFYIKLESDFDLPKLMQ